MSRPSQYAPSAIDNHASTIPGCPKHWTSAQDHALKAAYPKLHTQASITTFKRSVSNAISSTMTPDEIFINLRSRSINAVNIISYDLDFLSQRIKHLLGPVVVHNKGLGFLADWTHIPPASATRICAKGCLLLGRTDSHLWQNPLTQEFRCGGCGRHDLTVIRPDPSLLTVNTPVPTATSPPNTAFTGINATPSHFALKIPAPANWTQQHTRHLEENYITQHVQHHHFSIDALKMSLSVLFPPTHQDLNVAGLHVEESMYDFCFVHNQLEKLFGRCACRHVDTSPATMKKHCYLHPYVRIEMSDDKHLVSCGKCKLGGRAVYAIPVAGAGGKGGKCKGFRCGGCGNVDVEEIEM